LQPTDCFTGLEACKEYLINVDYTLELCLSASTTFYKPLDTLNFTPYDYGSILHIEKNGHSSYEPLTTFQVSKIEIKISSTVTLFIASFNILYKKL